MFLSWVVLKLFIVYQTLVPHSQITHLELIFPVFARGGGTGGFTSHLIKSGSKLNVLLSAFLRRICFCRYSSASRFSSALLRELSWAEVSRSEETLARRVNGRRLVLLQNEAWRSRLRKPRLSLILTYCTEISTHAVHNSHHTFCIKYIIFSKHFRPHLKRPRVTFMSKRGYISSTLYR